MDIIEFVVYTIPEKEQKSTKKINKNKIKNE